MGFKKARIKPTHFKFFKSTVVSMKIIWIFSATGCRAWIDVRRRTGYKGAAGGCGLANLADPFLEREQAPMPLMPPLPTLPLLTGSWAGWILITGNAGGLYGFNFIVYDASPVVVGR